jgi:UDP-2,3-diacylglucosamine hydrolase
LQPIRSVCSGASGPIKMCNPLIKLFFQLRAEPLARSYELLNTATLDHRQITGVLRGTLTGRTRPMPEKLGLIAGNGRFPMLVLDAARARGWEVVVAAIKEETGPDIEKHGAASVHWMSLGELSRLIDTFHREGVQKAVMAGQVKHKQIFSSIRPDWRLAKVLLSLTTRNTDSLIGAVAKVLGDEGITLINSTELLEPLLARAGVLSRRAPSEFEQNDIAYGRRVACALAQYDIGQTVVIASAACVAVEAMEGTDATIERAGRLMQSLDQDASTLSRDLTVVKIAKPNQDMRFDVPVVGVATIESMKRAGATCLAIDAGRCLLIDGENVIRAADEAGIAIVGGESQA